MRLSVLGVLLIAFPTITRSQEVFGAIRGNVTAGGRTVPAQVRLERTSFAAMTNAQGWYAIELVPAGTYSITVNAGQGRKALQQMVAVSAGLATRLDLAIEGDSVVASVVEAPLATSGLRLTGDELLHQGVDDPRHAVARSPGVVMRDVGIGIEPDVDLSIRGGARGEEATWVDGAPLRFQTAGGTSFTPGINMIGEQLITTGVSAAAFSDVRGGVVAYTTRLGTPRLSADLRGESDNPFGQSLGVGYNRYTANVGGPMGSHLLWFASASVQGQQSAYRGKGAADVPFYVPAGADTVVSNGFPPDTLTNFQRRTGLRRPGDWSTNRVLQGRALYSWGHGASASLTLLSTSFEQRTFSQFFVLVPALNPAVRDWSNAAIVNVGLPIGRFAGGTLALEANLALSGDDERTGPLTVASEQATRDPALGIELGTLEFAGDDVFKLPIDETFLRHLRINLAPLTPYFGQNQLRPGFGSRDNPYAVSQGGFATTAGIMGSISRTSERRTSGRAQADWSHGIATTSLGIDFDHTNLSFYASDLFTQINLDAFIEHPSRTGAYFEHRVRTGRLDLDAGVRYDRYAVGGLFNKVPGRVFSYVDSATHKSAYDSLVATSDAAYAAFLAKVYNPGQAQSFLLPRLRIRYVVSPRTAIRAGIGRQADVPDWRFQYAGVNTDFAASNGAQLIGRSGVIGANWLMEFGVQHQLLRDLSIDAAVYDKKVGSFGATTTQYYDPFYGTQQVAFTLTRRDDDGWGIDMGLRARWSWLDASFAWTMFKTSPTVVIGGPLGSLSLPETDDAFYLVLDAHTSDRGSLHGFGAMLTARATNGLPYTPDFNLGAGTITPSIGGNPSGSPNSGHLPFTKTLDLRLTKVLRLGGRPWTLFADFRNLLDFTNMLAVFSETGTNVNPLYQSRFEASQKPFLYFEAGSAVKPNGDVDLTSCASWGNNQLDCVATIRAEQRFGNGDKLFTVAEQTAAFDAWYTILFGPSRFNAPGRTIRIGVQLNH